VWPGVGVADEPSDVGAGFSLLSAPMHERPCVEPEG
jgi:hypothetical protein